MQDINQHSITEEVLRRIAATPDPRLHQILAAAVRYLHDFARETKLTEAEWLAGIAFLTETGHLSSEVRQEFILLSDTLGLSQLVVAQNHSREPGATAQTVLGPFHTKLSPRFPSHGANLAMHVPGEPLFVHAQVVSGGLPVADATVEIWQADADGHYDLQRPGWTAENATLRGVICTDAYGRFSFRSILPKSYPIPTDGTVGQMMRATKRSPMRPAHIHFRIEKPGFDTLITHVFAQGDEYLNSDAVFGVRASCVGQFIRHDAGTSPSGEPIASPYYTLGYSFGLEPRGAQ